MKVQIKKLYPEAYLPQYIKEANGAMQLIAIGKYFDEFGNAVYNTGLSIFIPEGHIGLIFPRSNNFKQDLTMSDSVGILSPGNTKEIIIRFKPVSFFADDIISMENGRDSYTFDYVCVGKEHIEDTDEMSLYHVGDRVAQLLIIPVPQVEWEETF